MMAEEVSERVSESGGQLGGQLPPVAETLSVDEAARLLGKPERTLRNWIGAGKLRTVDAAPPHRGKRVPLAEIHRLQGVSVSGQPVAEAVSETPSESGGHSPPAPAPVSESGGNLAAVQALAEAEAERARAEVLAEEVHRLKVENTRLSTVVEERSRRDEERAQENAWLRQQLDARAQAEEQLRILAQTAQRAVTALTEQAEQMKALPAPEEKRPWWKFRKG